MSVDDTAESGTFGSIDRSDARTVSTHGALDRQTSDIGFHLGYCVAAP